MKSFCDFSEVAGQNQPGQGTDAGTPVTDDYPARGNEFNGKINWVQIDLEPDDHSHELDTDHMAHVRLVKQ